MGSPSTVFNLPPTSDSTRRAAQSQAKGSARAAKNTKESSGQLAPGIPAAPPAPTAPVAATNPTPTPASPAAKPDGSNDTGRFASRRHRSVKRFEEHTPGSSKSGRTTPVSLNKPPDKSHSTKVPAAHFELQATVEIPRLNKKSSAHKTVVPESFVPVDLNATVEIIRPKATVTSKKVALTAPEQFATEEIALPQASGEKPQALQVGQVLTLAPRIKHDIEARDDSAFLVTLSWPTSETLQSLPHRGYGS